MTMLDRCAAIIAPEAFKSLSEHEAEWKAWVECQDFGDGGQKIDPLKWAMACAQSDYDDLAPRRARAIAKALAVLEALRDPTPEMIAAAVQTDRLVMIFPDDGAEAIKHMWTDMIEEALKERT